MKLKRILTVLIAAAMSIGMFGMNIANAAGTYSISCKNNAYGMQLGSDYTQIAYVYNAAAANTITGQDADAYLIMGNDDHAQAYVGNDCLYAGSADTNGTAVVAGDVARLAVNAIVGAVSNRIDMAYAANNSGASATGLSFTTQGDGLSMSANNLVGGISFWGDFGSSDIKNTQTFTNVRLDSNKYDGDVSSYSVGIDKKFGKALVGLVVSNLDTDFKTTFNDGTYKQEVDTYGIYLAYKTRLLTIDLGMGQGDSTIDTTRRDLGNDSVITGKTTADIEYSNVRVAAQFNRGKFSLVPSVSYRTMSMDIAAFTDDRPNETQSKVSGDGLLFTSGQEGNGASDGLTVTDDAIAARSVESETMEAGIKLSANLGKIVPYLNLSYASEDTTKASYKTETGTDGDALDVAASNYSSSYTIGGGINFMIGSHVNGGVRMGMVNGRDDWSESYMAGNLSIGF